VDKSLVIADRAAGSVRYRLLETIRQYGAQELLRAAGEEQVLAIRDEHARYFTDFADLAAPQLSGSDQGTWLRKLDAEWDNLRAALAHLRAQGLTGEVVRLGVALGRFVVSRGHTEVIAYLTQALDHGPDGPDPVRAAGHQVAAQLTFQFLRGDPAAVTAGVRHAEQALALARQVADRRVEARALGSLFVAEFVEHHAHRGELAEAALAIARSTGDPHVIGEMLAFGALDDLTARGRAIHEEALANFRSCGDVMFAAGELHALSGMDLMAGLIGQAREHVEQALALLEGLGDEVFRFNFRGDLAIIHLIQGEYELAEPHVRHCLLVARRTGLLLDVSEVIFAAGCLAGWRGDDERAARLFGAAERDLGEAMANGGIQWTPPEQELTTREHGLVRGRMGSGQFGAAFGLGSGLTRHEVVQLALERGGPERIAANSR
jgi:hypothetical protein